MKKYMVFGFTNKNQIHQNEEPTQRKDKLSLTLGAHGRRKWEIY